VVEYKGTIFSFNYDIEKENDEEFVAWLVAKLKKMNPLLPKIMDGLLDESEEFKKIKNKEEP